MIMAENSDRIFFVCSLEELGFLITNAIVYAQAPMDDKIDAHNKLIDSKEKCTVREINPDIVDQFFVRGD